MKITTVLHKASATLRAFIRARGGNVAMMFGLSLVPITIAAGVGLDFSRSMVVRAAMSEALDSAALAVGSTSGLTHDTAQALAQKFFNANYTGDPANGTPTIAISATGFNSNGSVTITATDSMPTSLLKMAGWSTVPVTTSTTVVWGQSKLWVALVLDNSGSMSQSDSTGSKMDALQSASHQLLTILQNAAANAGDVQVSIAPFTRVVNVGNTSTTRTASWLYWGFWEAAPQGNGVTIDDTQTIVKNGNPFSAYGPDDNCPFTTTTTSRGRTTISQDSPYGFNCTTGSANSAGNTATINDDGTICPGLDSGNYNTERNDRYYNGCWTSTVVKNKTVVVASCSDFPSESCTCKNGTCKSQLYSHTWVPNSHTTWSGCVTDRVQDYDIQNTTPSSANTTGIPADNPTSCLSATVTALNYNWTSLGSQIDAMSPNGSTNQAIGVSHGWLTLTPGGAYGASAVPANTSRFIILLSDGLNTQDRWYGDGATELSTDDAKIDDREKKTCDAAKADGITIYTIYLNIGGDADSAPLAYCASDSSKYFELTSTSAVVTTFNQIAQQITNVRVSQ